LAGVLTWAFEFEGQPYFAGFRTLATNGIDKPVLNLFRMAGMMRGDVVKTESSGAVPLETILSDGIRHKPDIDAVAVRSGSQVSVMVWNYHDDSAAAPPAELDMVISGIPPTADRVLLEQYPIDQDHSNSYTAWQEMGSPQNPSRGQYAKLEAAGQLELLGSPRWITVRHGTVNLRVSLERDAVSLLRLGW
jgi:xylan 1,4-beta-xylosidase